MCAYPNVGGIVVGKYRVERVLGRGGMGIVLAARHLRLGERVAIKFPAAQMCDHRDVVVRMVREGRAAMRIRSEHVARVYDVGALPTGEPFLVMEYLEGKDLGATMAERGPLPIEEAVEYILQATEALAEAHAHGIIHRDLKPSNLFLTRRADGSAVVKVIDFGISKLTRESGDDNLTGSSAVVGSRPYMAPEQMRTAREIDARSDIWSLGATLHTLLTGTAPFLGGTILEIHERILRGPPRLRAVCPNAPAALEAILIRCMSVEVADRYPDVAELAAALAEVAPAHARISALRAARILETARLTPDGAEYLDDGLDWGAMSAPSSGATRTGIPSEPSWRDAESQGATTRGRTVTLPPAARSTGTPYLHDIRLLALCLVAASALAFGVRSLLRGSRERVASSSAAADPMPLPAPSSEQPAIGVLASTAPGVAPSAALSSEPPARSSAATAARNAARAPWIDPRSPVPSKRASAPSFGAKSAPATGKHRDPLADPD